MVKKICIIIICICSPIILLAGLKKLSVESSHNKLYKTAAAYISEKQYPQAIGILNGLGSYKDSEDLLDKLRYVINGAYIAAGMPYIGAVTADGRVIQVNAYETALSTDEWKDVYHLSAKGMYLDGISSEGTIITTNPETPETLYNYIHNTEERIPVSMDNIDIYAQEILNLKNVEAFVSSYPSDCVVLTKDRKVQAVIDELGDEDLDEISSWSDIVSIAGFLPDVVGLRSDRTIECLSSTPEAIKNRIESWDNIVAISEGTYLFGLKSDGTVVSSGVIDDACKIESWKDIIAISASRITTIGLKSNGTVVAAGSNYYGQCNTERWTDIVAVSANEYYTLGLKSDGSLIITANIRSIDNFPDVSNISNLYVPKVD